MKQGKFLYLDIKSILVFFCIIGEAIKGANESAELEALAENFREQASKLVDMLDISIPVVAKLKVKKPKLV